MKIVCPCCGKEILVAIAAPAVPPVPPYVYDRAAPIYYPALTCAAVEVREGSE